MVPYLLSYNLGRTLIIVGRFKWRGKYTRGCFWTNLREAETDGRNIVTSSKVPSCQLLTFWNSLSPIQFSNQISQFRHFAVGWEQRARLFPFFFHYPYLTQQASLFSTKSKKSYYHTKQAVPYFLWKSFQLTKMSQGLNTTASKWVYRRHGFDN